MLRASLGSKAGRIMPASERVGDRGRPPRLAVGAIWSRLVASGVRGYAGTPKPLCMVGRDGTGMGGDGDVELGELCREWRCFCCLCSGRCLGGGSGKESSRVESSRVPSCLVSVHAAHFNVLVPAKLQIGPDELTSLQKLGEATLGRRTCRERSVPANCPDCSASSPPDWLILGALPACGPRQPRCTPAPARLLFFFRGSSGQFTTTDDKVATPCTHAPTHLQASSPWKASPDT